MAILWFFPNKTTYQGTFSFSAFRGRPRGRTLASKPRRFAVRSIHSAPPNGVPRSTLRRKRANSASVSGVLTYSIQRAGRGTGPASR